MNAVCKNYKSVNKLFTYLLTIFSNKCSSDTPPSVSCFSSYQQNPYARHCGLGIIENLLRTVDGHLVTLVLVMVCVLSKVYSYILLLCSFMSIVQHMTIHVWTCTLNSGHFDTKHDRGNV